MNYFFADRVASLQPSAIREILKYTSDPGVISFAAGNPAPEAFPVEQVREISEKLLRDNPIGALQYAVTEGYAPLREYLVSYMKQKHNIGRESDQLLITAGAQQVMDLATKSLCNEGDTVICESPSFIGSLNAFRSYGLKLCGIPMQDDGMDVEALEQALKTEKRARFIYTIPNFQNPSGITMSMEKRRRVYELARQYGVTVLEDNPYAAAFASLVILTGNPVLRASISRPSRAWTRTAASFTRAPSPRCFRPVCGWATQSPQPPSSQR